MITSLRTVRSYVLKLREKEPSSGRRQRKYRQQGFAGRWSQGSDRGASVE